MSISSIHNIDLTYFVPVLLIRIVLNVSTYLIPLQLSEMIPSASSSLFQTEPMEPVAVGTTFLKPFGRQGTFSGVVVSQHPEDSEDEEDIFSVQYDDGDVEDLSRSEIETLVAANPSTFPPGSRVEIEFNSDWYSGFVVSGIWRSTRRGPFFWQRRC